MNFGLSSDPNSPLTATPYSNNLDNSMMGFNGFIDSSWMFNDPSMATTFSQSVIGVNKLDFLACAVQQDLLMSTAATAENSTLNEQNAGEELSDEQHVCRW
jgi:hypothetical protein